MLFVFIFVVVVKGEIKNFINYLVWFSKNINVKLVLFDKYNGIKYIYVNICGLF